MRNYYRVLLYAALPFIVGIALPVYAQSGELSPEVRKELEEGHEKERSAWFMSFFTSGVRQDLQAAQADGMKQFRAMDNSASFKQAAATAWQPVAGSQGALVSGRASSLAFDPSNPNIMYLGEPQGGVWKTTDRGQSWTCMTDSWPMGVLGALGVDPINPQIVYAATGDIDPSDGLGGVGMYRSSDGGLNWTLVAPAATIGSKCLQVIPDPMSSTGQPAYCGTVYCTSNTGVIKSVDGGMTWKRILTQTGITSMVMDPTNTQTLIVGSKSASIRRSVDGGATWTVVGNNITGFGRIDLAMAPSNPLIIYGSLDMNTGAGLCKSTNGGVTWSMRYTGGKWLSQQGWYANTIAVNPTNPDMIVVGGLDIYRSDNGGLSFQQKTDWTAPSQGSNYTHADIHRLFYTSSALYTLTDGGVYHSSSNGDSWRQDMNKGLATLQFVGFDAAPDLSFFIGGAQDNGVSRAVPGQAYFDDVGAGDGGYTYVSQNDGGMEVYSTYYGTTLRKSLDAGQSWLGGGVNVLTNDTLLSEGTPFYMSYSVCESDADYVVIAGNSRAWYSSDGGGNFNSISTPGQIGGGVAKVHLPAADPTTVFAAGNNGFLYTSWQGGPWKRSQKAYGGITSIFADRDDPSIVYITVGGYGTPHFYVSTDTGKTFTAPATNMPDLPALSMAVGPDKVIYVGTSTGVVASKDGVHWIPLANGLPLLEIMSLQVRGGHTLVAGTYGRGAFTLDVSNLQFTNQVSAAAQLPTNVSLSNVYPNPIVSGSSASVEFSLPTQAQVLLAVYDELGRTVKVIENATLQKGEYTRRLDLTGLATGKYFYGLTALGQTVSHSLVITR